jgi:hypothetical protein
VNVILGIDPGPTTGFCILGFNGRWPASASHTHALACDAAMAPKLLDWLLEIYAHPVTYWTAGGIEEFRRGNIKGGQRNAGVTADLVVSLSKIAGDHDLVLACRPAVLVKRWASDSRLRAAGLYDITSKSVDARDAARHSLFAAVRDAGAPDPLSKRVTSPPLR